MKIKPIKTESEYREALKEISGLLNAAPDSKEAERLELLSILVEVYENQEFPIPESDPVTAIEFWMDQNGLSRKDMEPFIGSRARVTEILNRKRPLTLAMIRKLSQQLGIPSSLLIPPYPLRKAA